MKLFVCMMLVTMVVMATLIDDSEGWRRRRRRRRGRLDVDADGTFGHHKYSEGHLGFA